MWPWIGSFCFKGHYWDRWVSLVAQMVKKLPTMRETWVRSLSQEDLLEKGMATHSSILAQRIQRSLVGSQRVGPDWGTNSFSFTCFHPDRQSMKLTFLGEQYMRIPCTVLAILSVSLKLFQNKKLKKKSKQHIINRGKPGKFQIYSQMWEQDGTLNTQTLLCG